MKIIAWVKKNKLVSLLLLIIAFLLVKNKIPLTSQKSAILRQSYEQALPSAEVGETSLKAPGMGGMLTPAAPAPEVTDRLVVQESYMSLLVKDVRQKADEVIKLAEAKGGYLVSSNLSQPEEAPFATVTVRLPSDKLKETLEQLRSLAVRVTSENLQGHDVTDQYVDLEARLDTLNKTKAKFEDLLNKAFSVQDLLQVQSELVNLQDQIDSLKGRQDYLKKTAENAKLTVYLSSDELALPYAPAKPFRPSVIFKQAVRSLVTALRAIVKLAIWVAVFSVIWLPVLLIYKWLKKRKKK